MAQYDQTPGQPQNTDTASQAASPYPRWEGQFRDKAVNIEREIEQWYARNADTAGHPSGSSWFEREGTPVRRFFNEIKDSVKGWFGKDETDQDAHAEYEQAWNDDAHWQGRVKETAQNLEQQGRFGGPPAAGSSSGNV